MNYVTQDVTGAAQCSTRAALSGAITAGGSHLSLIKCTYVTVVCGCLGHVLHFNLPPKMLLILGANCDDLMRCSYTVTLSTERPDGNPP
jgi:hypothetical protein